MSSQKIVPKGEHLRTEISLRATRTKIVVHEDAIVMSRSTACDQKTFEERYPVEEMIKLPRSRKDANAAGSKRYYPKKPCVKGHMAPRLTCHATCVECLRLEKLTPKGRERSKQATYRALEHTREIKRLLESAPVEIRNLNERVVTDRTEAAMKGLMYYWDPTPCMHGHSDKLRYTRTSACTVCMRGYSKKSSDKKFIKDVLIDNLNLLANPTIIIE